MLGITEDERQPTPPVFMLVKFFERPTYAADFVSGKLFCNTVGSFKAREDPGNSGRVDRNEGTIAWLQPGQGRFELNGIDLTPDLAEPLQIQRSWLDYLHLFCVHAVHAGTFNLKNLSNEENRGFSTSALNTRPLQGTGEPRGCSNKCRRVHRQNEDCHAVQKLPNVLRFSRILRPRNFPR